MSEKALASTENFKKAFNQGLVSLLSKKSAGVFILALANALQNKEILESNKKTISETFSRLKAYYSECHDQGVIPDDASDDIDVMQSLFVLGLESIKNSKNRLIEHNGARWRLYYNHLRSFRPQRMSAQ